MYSRHIVYLTGLLGDIKLHKSKSDRQIKINQKNPL